MLCLYPIGLVGRRISRYNNLLEWVKQRKQRTTMRIFIGMYVIDKYYSQFTGYEDLFS